MPEPSVVKIGPVPGETLDDLRVIAAGLLHDGIDVSKLTDVGRAELRQAIDRILRLAAELTPEKKDRYNHGYADGVRDGVAAAFPPDKRREE